jgi:preprotein translocase subunit SecA
MVINVEIREPEQPRRRSPVPVGRTASHQQLGQFAANAAGGGGGTGGGSAFSGPAAASQPQGTVQVKRTYPKVGRNDPCPCGSGKKYKHCHGR